MTRPYLFDFPAGYRVGPVSIQPATVLAPMAGVTDTVFRRLIRNQGGCGLLMTEFTSSHGVVSTRKARKPTRNFRYLYFEQEEHPITCQLFGSDPEVMAEAAKVCEDRGFDIVDINFGCPVNKVVKCNGGSGLLRDLPLVEAISAEGARCRFDSRDLQVPDGMERQGIRSRANGAHRRRYCGSLRWRCTGARVSKATAAKQTGRRSPRLRQR